MTFFHFCSLVSITIYAVGQMVFSETRTKFLIKKQIFMSAVASQSGGGQWGNSLKPPDFLYSWYYKCSLVFVSYDKTYNF